MQVQLQARSRRAAGSALYAALSLVVLGLGPACESGEAEGEADASSQGEAEDEGSDDTEGSENSNAADESEGASSEGNEESGDEATAQTEGDEGSTGDDEGDEGDGGDADEGNEASSSGDDDSDDTTEGGDTADASDTGETTEGGDTADDGTQTEETEDDTGPGCRDEVADEIVAFEESCLEWVRNVTGMQTKLPWSEAAGMSAGQACEMLDLEGGGWRLPTIDELETIVVGNNTFPSIDPDKFPNTPPMLFWTSEENATSHKVTALDFSNNGTRLEVGPDGPQHYRCVRSSE